MAGDKGKSLDTSLRYGSVGVEREDVGKFPFDAFSFNTPDTDEPALSLNSPWIFDVNKLEANEITVTDLNAENIDVDSLTNNGLIEDREFLTATDDYVISSEYKYVYLTFTRQATDKTITLPDATGNLNQEIIIEVTGSGAGDVSLVGDSIDGIDATDWIWHGTGKLKIVSNGTEYKTLDQGIWDFYKASASSGQIAQKHTNKTMTQWLDNPIIDVINTLTTSGLYRSGANTVVTRHINFSTFFGENIYMYNNADSNGVFVSNSATNRGQAHLFGGMIFLSYDPRASTTYNVSYISYGVWVD